MSEDRQTFTDPQTGEEMESSWLDRGVTVLASLLVGGLVGALSFWWQFGLPGVLLGVLFGMMVTSYIGWILWDLRRRYRVAKRDRLNGITDWDRLKHRRQWLLRSRDHENVPDGALSRAQSPGEPQPTDAALSLADTGDEKARLVVSTDTTIAEKVPVNRYPLPPQEAACSVSCREMGSWPPGLNCPSGTPLVVDHGRGPRGGVE